MPESTKMTNADPESYETIRDAWLAQVKAERHGEFNYSSGYHMLDWLIRTGRIKAPNSGKPQEVKHAAETPDSEPLRAATPAAPNLCATSPPSVNGGGEKAESGWREKCRIVKTPDGKWDVRSPGFYRCWNPDCKARWHERSEKEDKLGGFDSEEIARAALAQAPPPPDAESLQPECPQCSKIGDYQDGYCKNCGYVGSPPSTPSDWLPEGMPSPLAFCAVRNDWTSPQIVHVRDRQWLAAIDALRARVKALEEKHEPKDVPDLND